MIVGAGFKPALAASLRAKQSIIQPWSENHLAVTGAGIAGGIAGGALAGLACGPGAPVCVTVGVFVGGALAAFGVDFFW